MARIDSGLGWSCGSDFYVDTAGTLIDYPNGDLIKTNNGGAIVGYHHNQLDWYCLYMISTVPENCMFSCENSSCTVFNNTANLVVDGVTWYMSSMYNNNSSYATDSQYVSDYEFILNSTSSTTNAQYITAMLTAANVVYDKKIPSTDYVKSFVEGVFTENNKRIATPSVIGAPLFSEAVSYSVNDLVIRNGGLYKCTSAHSGAWNAADFTQTSIIEMISG